MAARAHWFGDAGSRGGAPARPRRCRRGADAEQPARRPKLSRAGDGRASRLRRADASGATRWPTRRDDAPLPRDPRGRGARERLLRFVLDPEGRVRPDLDARLPGRGMWLSADRNVLNKAVARNLFARAARAPARVAVRISSEQVEGLLARRALATLGLGAARRSGRPGLRAGARRAALGVARRCWWRRATAPRTGGASCAGWRRTCR